MKHRPPRGLSIGHVWQRSARMGSQTLSSFLAQARPPAHRSRATRHPPSCISSDETRHQPARRSRCPCRRRIAASGFGDEGGHGVAAEEAASIREHHPGTGTSAAPPVTSFASTPCAGRWRLACRHSRPVPSRTPPSSRFLIPPVSRRERSSPRVHAPLGCRPGSTPWRSGGGGGHL